MFAALSLDPLFAAPTLRGAHVGALVVAADTGAVVYSRGADDAFIPASTFKLLVGSAALDELGNAWSFATTLATDGTNLYLRGGGDPTLDDTAFDDAIETLQSLGQTSYPGKLYGDVSAVTAPLYPDGWSVDDLAYDYAAPPNALSFQDNALHIRVTPAKRLMTMSAAAPYMQIDEQWTIGPPKSDDTLSLELDLSKPHGIRVVGSVPSDEAGSQVDASVLDPAAFTLAQFEQRLGWANVHAPIDSTTPYQITPPNARVLWTHHSVALPQMLALMWQPSDNVIGESLLDALGAGVPDARAAGIGREVAWLRSIDVEPETLTIADGSGLSSYDRVTPRALVTILRHEWAGTNREGVMSALPQPGKKGTLEDVFANSPLVGKLFAKTGTVNHTRTLAGYLETNHGTVVFALLVNDWMDTGDGASKRLRAFQQTFLEHIQTAGPSV